MESDSYQRSVLAASIGLIVLVIVYFLVPGYPMQPQGVLLPSAKPLTAIAASQVTLYDASNAPYAFQQLGHINLEYSTKLPPQQAYLALSQRAQQLAAKVGANGVVVDTFGRTPSQAALSYYVFRAKAIYAVANI